MNFQPIPSLYYKFNEFQYNRSSFHLSLPYLAPLNIRSLVTYPNRFQYNRSLVTYPNRFLYNRSRYSFHLSLPYLDPLQPELCDLPYRFQYNRSLVTYLDRFRYNRSRSSFHWCGRHFNKNPNCSNYSANIFMNKYKNKFN